jgi:hypothetical protein
MAKRSKTYNRLKPFIVETIANTRARGSVSAGGTGGGGAGVTDHGALTGLGDDDHAQYLLASGGRALAGNMAVNSGVTIDGVDLSAPTQGITLSGSSYILASSVGGDGLTYTAGVLAVGVANTGATGLSVEANAVRLTSSSDVGTTPAAAILASTAAGALTLASLTAKGNIDVTSGGDLTVGSNILFVDASQSNVGINCSPDPQFDLDVNGNLRATYIIGKHAIQLKGVLLLSHFDGKAPYETNYSGEPTGHMGQVASPTGGVIFRPGKFYKALQVAAAATNVISNPSFETNTTGWSAILSASIARTNEGAVIGSYCAGVTTAGSNTGGVTFAYTTSTGGAWTASVYLKAYTAADVGDNVSVRIRFNYTDVTSADTAVNHALTSDWTRVSVSATANGAKTVSSIEVHVRDLLSQSAHQWLMDAVQLEVGAIASPYCDGTLGGYTAGGVPDGSGHAWSGTAHASTSSRTAGSLTYPTAGNLLPNVGTVMAWVNPSYLHPTDNQTVFRATGTTAGHIMLRLNSVGKPQAYWGTGALTAAAAITAGAWTHLAMTYDGTTLSLYVNGVLSTSGAASGFSGMPTTLYAGVYAGAEWFGGLIDDLCILERACVADEIRSIYESDAPVFAETARFSFRATPKGLVWADDEGLWMRDATGGPVLGAYGGEAASKSWASLTLAAGDVVLGDGASSYLLWDDSAGTLKLNTLASAKNAYMLLSGFYLDMYADSVRRFRFDADLGQVWIGRVATNSANVYITDSLLAMCVNTTEKVILSSTGGSGSGGYILVGETSSTSKNNVYIDADGMKFRQGTSITNVSISTAGVITVGEVDTGKSNVLISSGAVKLRNNTTDVITLRATPGTQNTLATFDGSIEVAANVFAGSYNVRMGTDGHRLVLPSSASLNISSSSSAIRWFPAIDSTPGVAVDYAGQVAYINTGGGGNVLDGLFTAYVGSTNYTTRDARIGLQAGHSDGTTYTDAYLLIVREMGSGKKYGLFVGDEFDIDGTLYLKSRGSAPGMATASECHTYVRNGKFVVAYNDAGTKKYRYLDLTSTNATWTYTTTAP